MTLKVKIFFGLGKNGGKKGGGARLVFFTDRRKALRSCPPLHSLSVRARERQPSLSLSRSTRARPHARTRRRRNASSNTSLLSLRGSGGGGRAWFSRARS